MERQQPLTHHYRTVAAAIDYIRQHFRAQPSLEAVAAQVGLSPFHFQRVFSEWAGVSPKQFVRYLSFNYARDVLHRPQATLFDAAYEAGLSGTGRLHDLFVQIESMTPGEYKKGGEGLRIRYQLADTLFGQALVAATDLGVCHLSFVENEKQALDALRLSYPRAHVLEAASPFHAPALDAISGAHASPQRVKLHLRGTPFQLKVWHALLQIPPGALTSYGRLAGQVGHKGASRAVGTAVGDNPVAFIIPCHRVIQAGGHYGNYRWGAPRKSALIAWEAAQHANQHTQP